MSLTQTAFKVQSFLERFVPPPYSANLDTGRLVTSAEYNKKRHKKYRILVISLLVLLFPFVFWRSCWLFYNWKTYTQHNVDQAIVYAFIICGIIIFWGALHVVLVKYEGVVYMVNQCIKIGICYDAKVKIFILLIPGGPFAITFDPIQVIFGADGYLVKFGAGAFYSGVGVYIVCILLSAFILLILFLEGMLTYSLLLHFHHTKLKNPMVHLKFEKCHKLLREIEILLKVTDHVYGPFLIFLIIVGILMAPCGAHITVKMYDKLNILTFAVGPIITLLFFSIAISLTFLSNFPQKHSKIFIQFWKSYLILKRDKKILRACKPLGFNLGPYGVATAKLGIIICDDMVQNTVTLMLLDSF